MGRKKRHHTALRWTVWVLLAGSVLLWVLPRRWTAPLISAVQVLVPFQDAALVAADSISSSLTAEPQPVSAEEYDSLEREKQAYQHQATSLALRVIELEQEVAVLAATRAWRVGDSAIGPRGQLISARVLTGDSLPWRDSWLVGAGTFHGVRRGAPVATAHFTIDRGEAEGVRTGLAVLRSETLVGRIDQVGTHTARVRAVSDVGVQMKVQIGSFSEQGFRSLERPFWLVGRGAGRMEIGDIDRRDVESGAIQIGDSVLSEADADFVPVSLQIGTITDLTPDLNNPLLSIATVRATVDPAQLRKVYVYDAQ